MATIIRQEGFRIAIFPNDHGPPHVHVFRAGTEAIVELLPLQIRENYRMPKRQLRRAVEIVQDNVAILIEAWREIHEA